MTGGRLKRLKKFLNETFLLTYGDGLSDIDLKKLYNFHKRNKKMVTLTAVRPKTSKSLAPATAHPYSQLPMVRSTAMFPATRTLKISPIPKSKIISVATRESMQARTVANGYCA